MPNLFLRSHRVVKDLFLIFTMHLIYTYTIAMPLPFCDPALYHICLFMLAAPTQWDLNICSKIWSQACSRRCHVSQSCRIGEESISLPFLACRNRFAVNNIWAQSQSSMLFHLPGSCQLYTTELHLDREIRKHTHTQTPIHAVWDFF